jgi:hypothetical protein
MGREWMKEARAIKVAVAEGGGSRIRMTRSSGGCACAREKINEPSVISRDQQEKGG